MRQQGVPHPGTPFPTKKGRHAVSAANTPATGCRAASSAALHRGDDRPEVTGLGGVVAPPPPPQIPPASGGMVIAPGTDAAFVPASAYAGGRDSTGASVLALAGVDAPAAACCASANRRGYTPSPSAAVAAARSTGNVPPPPPPPLPLTTDRMCLARRWGWLTSWRNPRAVTNVWLRATTRPLPLRGSLRLYWRRRWTRRSELSRVRRPPLPAAPRHPWRRVRGRRYCTLLSLPLVYRPHSRAGTRRSGGGFVKRQRSPAGQRRSRQPPPPSEGNSLRR